MKIPALLNGKDICPEFDWLFDGEKSVSHNCKELGYIKGIACMTTYYQNIMSIKVIDYCLTDTDWITMHLYLVNEIAMRLHNVCNEQDYYPEIEKVGDEQIFVRFYWRNND